MATYDDMPDKCAKQQDNQIKTRKYWTKNRHHTKHPPTPPHLLDSGDKLGLLLRLVISPHIKPQLAQSSSLKWSGTNLGLWVVAKLLHWIERSEAA